MDNNTNRSYFDPISLPRIHSLPPGPSLLNRERKNDHSDQERRVVAMVIGDALRQFALNEEVTQLLLES